MKTVSTAAIRGLGLIGLALALSACATSPDEAVNKSENGDRYERPDHVTGTNLVRRDRAKPDVKEGDKDAIEAAAMRSGAATAARLAGGRN